MHPGIFVPVVVFVVSGLPGSVWAQSFGPRPDARPAQRSNQQHAPGMRLCGPPAAPLANGGFQGLSIYP